MRAEVIDHVNLRIPRNGVDDAVWFYRDLLGFAAENLEGYRAGANTLFSFRPARGCKINIRPVAQFEPPGVNFDHFAVVVDCPAEEFCTVLSEAGVEINRERDRSHLSGAGVAVYIEDPFGYALELRPRPC